MSVGFPFHQRMAAQQLLGERQCLSPLFAPEVEACLVACADILGEAEEWVADVVADGLLQVALNLSDGFLQCAA